MKPLKHQDGLNNGGIPAEIWNDLSIQNYTGGFGAIYHELRTNKTDRHLISLLRANGLTDRECASFLVSRQGRHMMDCYSFGFSDVEKNVKSTIDWWKKYR
jgi:hypothetical protein